MSPVLHFSLMERAVFMRARKNLMNATRTERFSERDHEMLEKYPNLRIYPLLEEPLRDLLNRFPPRP